MREEKKRSVYLGFRIFCPILTVFLPFSFPQERRLAHRTTWNTNGCAFVIHETRFGFNSSRCRRRSVRRCSGRAIAIAIAIAIATATTLWHRGGRGGERGRIDGGAIARFESKEKSNRESDGLFDWTVSVGRVVDIRIWDGFGAQGGDFGAVADGE